MLREMRRAKIDWISEELRKVLDENEIGLFEVDYDARCSFVFEFAVDFDTNSAFMFETEITKTNGRGIVIVTEDVLGAELTHAEAEAMIWHEVAHIIHDATEFEADVFAAMHSSYEVWRSAMLKAETHLGKRNPADYGHRIEEVTEVTWLSEELREALDENDIDVFAFDDDVKGILYIGEDCKTNRHCISIAIKSVDSAKLTHAEVEALLWAEIAQIIHIDSPLEIHVFIATHTSFEVWRSALIKFDAHRGAKRANDYSHRNRELT